jgi:hypothetical protein
MLAVENMPTEQPARVNGTQGAGVCRLVSPDFAGTELEYTMVGEVSCPGVGVGAVSYTGSVQ